MHAESTQALDANGQSAGTPNKNATSNNGAISNIAREFQNLVADIEELIQSSTSLNGEDLAQAKAKLHARVAAAKDSLQKIGTPLTDRARSTVKGTDRYVRDQPWGAVGIAAGVSLLVGYLLGRRA